MTDHRGRRRRHKRHKARANADNARHPDGCFRYYTLGWATYSCNEVVKTERIRFYMNGPGRRRA